MTEATFYFIIAIWIAVSITAIKEFNVDEDSLAAIPNKNKRIFAWILLGPIFWVKALILWLNKL